MKKMITLVLLLSLFVMPAMAETPAADVFTSASVADFYADSMLSGDDLMNSINAYDGFFCTATVNPDGTPNVGFFIFSCVKLDDKYYLQLGLAENQTKANIANGSDVVVMYAPVPSAQEGAKPYAVSGARLYLERATDADLLIKLMEIAPQQSDLLFEITDVRPLG